MRSDRAGTYTEAGWLNTANAAGYLLGAVLTFALVDRLGARRIFVAGILATPLALAGSAAFAEFWLQSAFRAAAGIAGAGFFISGGAMVAMLFRDAPARNALAISLYFGGGGLGMIASGAVLPILLARLGDAAWPFAWLYLAALSCSAVAPALWAARRCPEPAVGRGPARLRLPLAGMLFGTLAYFLFAVGYIVYLTFLVALMRANYLSAATDIRIMPESAKLGRRIAATEPFAGLVEREEFPGPATRTDDQVLDYIRTNGSTVYDPCGTARMGTDDRAVVDPDLRMRGVAGLRVADASEFPLVPSANIHPAVLMLAERAAQMIRRAA